MRGRHGAGGRWGQEVWVVKCVFSFFRILYLAFYIRMTIVERRTYIRRWYCMDQRVPPSRQNRIMDILIPSRRTQVNIQSKTHI